MMPVRVIVGQSLYTCAEEIVCKRHERNSRQAARQWEFVRALVEIPLV